MNSEQENQYKSELLAEINRDQYKKDQFKKLQDESIKQIGKAIKPEKTKENRMDESILKKQDKSEKINGLSI